MKSHLTTAFLLLLLSFPAAFGQEAASKGASASSAEVAGSRFMSLSELKPGMRGNSLTVFTGTEPEEFDVEILGILPGWIGPNQDLILGRISGGGADRTKVFAGMSGSPVYVNGKLVGAISYSFPFATEAICGITPIEQMVSIFEESAAGTKNATKPRAYSFAELAAAEWMPAFPGTVGDTLLVADTPAAGAAGAVTGQSFRPITVPVSFSGLSQATLNAFTPHLLKAGLLPVSAPVGAAKPGPMKKADASTLNGGDSLAVHLTLGDISMAASGTVTMRDGDKVYGFGHPFLGVGASSLPMSESHVVTVVPNMNNSFKLAVPDAMVGSMTQDRATGVLGKLGEAPSMIPVTIRMTTSRGQQETINFQVARDELLTPLLLNMAVFNTITANERSLGDLMVEVKGKVAVAGHDAVVLDGRFAGQAATRFAAGSVVVPVGNLLTSRFDNLDISQIDIELISREGSATGELERIEVDRTEAKAGETVYIQAFVRGESGRIFTQRIPFTIPADTPSGTLTLEVGDGGKLQEKTASKKFVPNNLSELIEKINEVKRNDRLYVHAFRVTKGAIVGANEMPNLPPSVLATMNNDRAAGGFKPTVETVVTEVEVAPAEFIVSGQQTIKIEVVK